MARTKFHLCLLLLQLLVYGNLLDARKAARSASAATPATIEAAAAEPFWLDPEELSEESIDLVDWRQHPCRRECRDNEPAMECRYTFHIEHYYAMSKACYDCPYNVTDCARPHCIPADGVNRPLVVVNRQMPGPSIEVCQGDRVIVDAVNMMHADSTTLHWHGQHLRTNPYMDGTPFVSQCPILPGASFRYDFVAETAGSHFWHSHVGFQRGDGMFGPMIVRKQPKRDQLRNLYDHDEHHLIISDWDHELGLDKFLAHYHGMGDNKPPNLLVNGLGRFTKLADEKHNRTALMPTATFRVKQGSRHRFRIMNAEFLNCPIELSIDNHTLWVVSSDGRDLEPVEARSLVTYAGERFDVIVEMDQAVANYWIRFRGLLDCGPTFTKAYQVAVLRYEGAPEDEDPEAEVDYDLPAKEAGLLQINSLNKGTETEEIMSVPQLDALDKNGIANDPLIEPDYKFYISYDFYAKDNSEFHRKNLYGFHQVAHKRQKVGTPQLNHISMKMPTFPLMSQTEQIDSSGFCNSSTVEGCETDYCKCSHVLQVKLGSVVELILVDEGVPYDANHPFHLHGHDFRVLAMERLASNVTVDQVKRHDAEGRIKRKFDRAPIKDTVTVPDGGYTVIRFHADNPGYWLFHCHIEFHSEVGMALVFKIGEHEDFAPVPVNFPRCGDYRSNGLTTTTTTTTTTTPRTTTSKRPVKIDNVEDNEIGYHAENEVRKSIATWLPLILSEIRAYNSSGTIATTWSVFGLIMSLSWSLS
ncbi:laccase-1-like [Trichogramma pretiosum]|uniref:laccase-1-like n=1 Tax=Trichogramma pretiosum TaxID=7493 RepID=UPI0006C9AA50|nr:laccase-1-like [Trichogramma pretiosum]XP_014230421.1 laccase-1-like [Trichogramma pretiosum]